METLLDDFKLISAVSRAEISAVELIGGGSRMKSVQSILEKAFSAPLSRTLDAASTVALGTAVYVRISSPLSFLSDLFRFKYMSVMLQFVVVFTHF